MTAITWAIFSQEQETLSLVFSKNCNGVAAVCENENC